MYFGGFAVKAIAVFSAIVAAPGPGIGFHNFVQQIPIHGDSQYFRAMAPGFLAFKRVDNVWGGLVICEFFAELITGSEDYDCHPHPHNYYLQMLGEETGIVGLLTGALFLRLNHLGLRKACAA